MIEFILTDKAKELSQFDFTPKRGTPQAAGYDLAACIEEEITVYPGSITKIPLGIKIYLASFGAEAKEPQLAFAGLLFPRSSNSEMVLTNTIGLADEDYQGELFAKVTARENSFVIKPGERIVQYVVIPTLHFGFKEVEEFSVTSERGENGDGSTGGR